MSRLYLGEYIKKDILYEALHSARIKGKLLGVSDNEIKAFVDGFEKVIDERHMKFGDKISYSEMKDIINIMEKDHTDIVDNKELGTISEILLDKDFIF